MCQPLCFELHGDKSMNKIIHSVKKLIIKNQLFIVYLQRVQKSMCQPLESGHFVLVRFGSLVELRLGSRCLLMLNL